MTDRLISFLESRLDAYLSDLVTLAGMDSYTNSVYRNRVK